LGCKVLIGVASSKPSTLHVQIIWSSPHHHEGKLLLTPAWEHVHMYENTCSTITYRCNGFWERQPTYA